MDNIDFKDLIRQQLNDQAMAGMKDIAANIAAFHEQLVEDGVGADEALELTKEFMAVLFHHFREMNN